MPFISYAQNFEDVMLWRALKHVSNGFYIDVGAWSPDLDSVTRAFYEAGWHGINIEPNAMHLNDYAHKRIRDINLCIALSDEPGEIDIHIVSNSGLSTMKSEYADQHLKAGMGVHSSKVKVDTLNSIWDQYVGESDVHFLKIDVEGFELKVISGNDWQKHRPWILVVEATEPGTPVESYQDWEPALVSNSYKMVYADGLNRYYLAEEHLDLINAFSYPPNVFDDFLPASVADARKVLYEAQLKDAEMESSRVAEIQSKIQAQEAEAKAQEAEAKAQEAEAKAQEAEAKAQEAEAKAQEAEARAQEAEARAQEAEDIKLSALYQIDVLRQSTSWKLTKLLRFFSSHLKSK